MGHGIAQVAAVAGYAVVLHDADQDRIDQGPARIRRNLDDGVSRGKVAPESRDRALGGLTGSIERTAAAAEADLVIEAVPEWLDLKIELLRAVEDVVAPDTLLATNTSSLSVTTIQECLSRPDRFVGLHFFNPVHIMKLVEVVRGGRTGEASLDAAVAFVHRLEKEPIVVRDSPGFASSRLGVALGLEAIRMLEEGVASADAIDKAMELGYRHPMGPFRLTDLIGLDVRLDIATYLHETLGTDAFRPPELLRRMVAEGRLGRKSGQGFYHWTD